MTRVYQTQPKPHRQAVTQVDAADPSGTGEAVITRGYRECRFDVDLAGQDISGLVLELMFYNARLGAWFAGARYELEEAGRHSLTAETRGAAVFLKVAAFSGTSFELSADYCLS
jgi:hypothetical protein